MGYPGKLTLFNWDNFCFVTKHHPNMDKNHVNRPFGVLNTKKQKMMEIVKYGQNKRDL